MVRGMTVERAWQRLVSWCERNAPVTFGQLRPPAPMSELEAAQDRFVRRWPDDLSRWYALHDGFAWDCADTPLPDRRVLSLEEMADRAEMFAGFYEEGDQLVRDGEQQTAGDIAFAFLPSFVPIGENVAGCFLFVDTRPGPRYGCVSDWDHDEGALREPKWASATDMLEAVAAALEAGELCDGWLPTVEAGELIWELVGDQSEAARGWQRVYDMFHEFFVRRDARGEQFDELIVHGRNWNDFEYDVVDNVLSNLAFHNRVPAKDWPPGALAGVHRDLAALRAVLPFLPVNQREYFTFIATLGETVLTTVGSDAAGGGKQ
jgi:cell wall assembly regulator SMI1